VRRAEYIVARLLEASAKGTTLRFGPGDDPYGEEFVNFAQALEGNQESEMLTKGYSFAVLKNPVDVGVYSLKPQILTMERGVDLIAQTFGIEPETKVHFAKNSGSPGTPIPLKDVFRERPMHKKTGEVEPGRKNPVKVSGIASQPADEPLEMTQPDPKREAYIQSLQGSPVVQNTPLDFGMEVDTTSPEGGVKINYVIPGGPASQAGLKNGDRITRVSFETSTGSWGPYKVKTLADFKQLRQFFEPGYTVGVKYVRGSHEYPAGIQFQDVEPTPTKSRELQRAEAYSDPEYGDKFRKAVSDMEQHKADLSSLTVDELSKYYSITPQEVVHLLHYLGARTQDYIPSEEQPNERDPARVTGNQPVNPSALT